MPTFDTITRSYWRTDTKASGRQIYMCLSNDPAQPSNDDPLVGVLESSQLAEEVVHTHNDALAMFGRRYRTALQAQTPLQRASTPVATELDLNSDERKNVLEFLTWLRHGFSVMRLDTATVRGLIKIYRSLGGEDA